MILAERANRTTLLPMNHDPLPQRHDLLGIGLYAVGDAARLLRTPSRTIRRWLGGYGYREGNKVHRVPALWEPDLPKFDDHLELSFRDLIELRFVKSFIHAGLGLKTIRHCLALAQECVESDRPFSTSTFRTDGRTIFLESLEASDEPKMLDLRKRQYVFKKLIEETFKDLDMENDVVARWRPYRGKQSIVIDPERAFGQPIAAESGVPTTALADAVAAEGSIERVARLFELSERAVRDAVSFESELRAA
jgi:uncharacterized protein (DUF433 family)